MGPIARFITNVGYKLMECRITWEIYNRVFPHVHQEADYGYPFASNEELNKRQVEGISQAVQFLKKIDEAGDQMPEAEGNAFRYIIARELQVTLRKYLKYAAARKYPDWARSLSS